MTYRELDKVLDIVEGSKSVCRRGNDLLFLDFINNDKLDEIQNSEVDTIQVDYDGITIILK